MMVPKIEPMGSIPMRMDCAADFEMVMSYSSKRMAMGTEVTSLRPYPNMRALREMMSPIIIILAVLFNLVPGRISVGT